MLAACSGSGSGTVPTSTAASAPTETPSPTPAPTATPTPNPLTVRQWDSNASSASPFVVDVTPITPAAGDLVIVALWDNGQSNGSANLAAPPDSSWSLVDSNTSHLYAAYQLYKHVAVAGEVYPYQFTTPTAGRQIAWMSVDLAHTSSAVDGAANAYINGSSTTWTAPSLTPAKPNDLAIVMNMPITQQSLPWTNDATWTTGLTASRAWDGESLMKALSGTASVSETSTLSAAQVGFSAILLVTPQ
jgi:hypothetical protein